MKRRNGYNPKRRMASPPAEDERRRLNELAQRVVYGGNPEHKRDPGDFSLNPPSSPRPAKTLCDDAGIFRRADALRLLKEGLSRGLVSLQTDNGWPQNVWALTDDGQPLEAQLENKAMGSYHGYPMPQNDPFRDEVIRRWRMQ